MRRQKSRRPGDRVAPLFQRVETRIGRAAPEGRRMKKWGQRVLQVRHVIHRLFLRRFQRPLASLLVDWICPVRIQAVAVLRIQRHPDADLPQVGGTCRLAGTLPDRAEDRKQNRRQHRDGGDDNEQLNQSETSKAATVLHVLYPSFLRACFASLRTCGFGSSRRGTS